MINELIQLMKSQEKHLVQLFELLKIQKEMIMKKDTFGLEGLVDKLSQCSKRIAQEEVQRRKLLNNESIKDFVSKANNNELINSYEILTNTLNQVVFQKETNEILLKQQLIFNSKILNAIIPKQSTPIYNSTGNVNK